MAKEISDGRYDHYTDPGHGWLCVPRRELFALGIADLVSTYSYQKKDKVYLEEDDDAALFRQAWEARKGRPLSKRHRIARKNYSRIRNYHRFYVTDSETRDIRWPQG